MSKATKKVKAKKASKKTATRHRTPAKGPLDLKQKLEMALRAAFSNDTVDISNGYKGNVHVLVVSRKFDGKSEYERQELLHALIRDAGLTKPQQGKISLLLAMSPSEIK
jgi:stress-induced morphogen